MSSQQSGASARQDLPAVQAIPADATAAESPAELPPAAVPPAPMPPAPMPPAPMPAAGGQPAAADLAAAGPTAAAQLPLAGTADKTPWKSRADGKSVFRREAPFIFFWIWIAFVIFNVVQVAIPDHNYFSVELTVGLISLTGVGYACGLRPRVIADDQAIEVRNPLRDHRVPWGALSAVSVSESVELTCSRSAPKKDKTIYCWALYAGRAARRRKATGSVFGSMRSQMSGHSRLPAEARDLATRDTVELMATELATRLEEARRRSVPAAVLESRMAWVPVAAILVPAAALLALLLAR